MNEKNDLHELEQIWLVLEDLYEDLAQKNIANRSVASDLRYSKTLINSQRTCNLHHNDKDTIDNDEKLLEIRQILDRIENTQTSIAMNLDEDYSNTWMKKINEAECAKSDCSIDAPSSKMINRYDLTSVPIETQKIHHGLEDGWTRLTLSNPIDKTLVEKLDEKFGVSTLFEDDYHIIIRGKNPMVNRVAQTIYDHSLSITEPFINSSVIEKATSS
jgi:hypothetical protein